MSCAEWFVVRFALVHSCVATVGRDERQGSAATGHQPLAKQAAACAEVWVDADQMRVMVVLLLLAGRCCMLASSMAIGKQLETHCTCRYVDLLTGLMVPSCWMVGNLGLGCYGCLSCRK
jgi:hypothetical protein